MKEIPVGRPNVILRRCVRPPPEHLLADKPLVVVFIEFRFEPWIGNIVRGSPLPDVADHLIAPVRALAAGKRAYRADAPEFVFKQVRARKRWTVITPGEAHRICIHRSNARSLFPFGFGWETLAGPLGERGDFVEAHVCNRVIELIFDWMKARKVSDHPLVALQLPIQRRLPTVPVNTVPGLCEPPPKIRITTVADELEVLAVADWRTINCEIL